METPGARHYAIKERIRSLHLVSTVITLAATALFVIIASNIVPPMLSAKVLDLREHGLAIAFVLNVALILFAWRRSRDLHSALVASAEADKRAHESAYCDHLTGLPNRRSLAAAINLFATTGARGGTLLLIDLDGFKKVNDLYGHAAGDNLLRCVGGILKQLVPANACCARIGGDEFGIFLPSHLSTQGAETLAQHILDRLTQPIALEETMAHVSASVGIAKLDGHCSDADSLMRRSDIAMYEAKRSGRNCFFWFDAEMARQLRRRIGFEAEIRTGIARNEFVPFYQPLIDLENGKLNGFEMLCRWKHPRWDLLEPAQFIPIAEATGLISPLSFSVMRQALEDAKTWPAELHLSVNISPVQFKDPLLAQRILQLLTEFGFPPNRFEIEITETTLFDDKELALATIESFKNAGIRIVLDDFGTGYASLTQLRSLPFDGIKIDRSFISGLLEDSQTDAIVSTIALLGRSLSLPITAEGVESEAVMARLEHLGCSHAQGWLFGKAVPANIVQELLASKKLQPQEAAPGVIPVPAPPAAADADKPAAVPPRKRSTG